MTLRNFSSTAAETTLSAGVDASTTTFLVTATTGFPSAPFILAVDAGAAGQELVLVTTVAGTTLTVVRAYDSTVASAHDTGAVVAHSHGGIDFREANAHVNGTSGVHGATGAIQGLADVQALLLAAHPVGDIKMSVVNVNPSTYLGGTWVAWGSGRVPVGVDLAQTEFNSVEKTNSANTKTHALSIAEMPSHNHGGVTSTDGDHTHVTYAGSVNTTTDQVAGSGVISTANDSTTGAAGLHNHSLSINLQGGGAAHNNLQPYITCYMFKRVS